MELSFNCTKVNEQLSADKTVWQPHLSSVGVCETDAIAAKVAAKTKDDPEVIKLYTDVELADAFDGLVPVKLTAEQLKNAIKFSNVMDVGTQHMGEIHGTGEFMILGNGITLDGDGESAKLLDKKTGEVLATAEVSTVSKGQRATCKFAAVPGGIAKGAYTLEVTTFGLVGETTPRVFRKPVTLVESIPEPEPTTITNICSEGHEDDHFVVRANCNPIITGTNLKATGDDQASYQGFGEGGSEPSGHFPLSSLKVNTDTRLVFDRTKVQGDPFTFMIGSDIGLSVKGTHEWAAYLNAET